MRELSSPVGESGYFVSVWMKARSQASNGWLATELKMGAAGAVSRMVGKFNREGQDANPAWQRLIAKGEN